jgi:hypothetical protein
MPRFYNVAAPIRPKPRRPEIEILKDVAEAARKFHRLYTQSSRTSVSIESAAGKLEKLLAELEPEKPHLKRFGDLADVSGCAD